MDSKVENGKSGLIDKYGRWVVKPIYNIAYWSDEWNCGIVQEVGVNKRGAVDNKGRVIIPCQYSELYPVKIDGVTLSKDLFFVYKEIEHKKLNGIYDVTRKREIVKCCYEEIYTYSNAITVRNAEGKYGLLDYEGSVILEVVYSNFLIDDGHTRYLKINIGGDNRADKFNPSGGKWGMYDTRTREMVVDIKYNGILETGVDGAFAVNIGGFKTVGGKWGLYANGYEVVKCQYDSPIEFRNDVAMVKKDGEVKLIKNPLKDEAQILVADGNGKPSGKKSKGPAVSRYPAPDSDVDSNIPENKRTNDNTFAVIIANENYPEAPVPYALNDGRMFREYCRHTLGIPDRNVEIYEDASYGNIITAVDKIRNIAEAYDGEASVIFYYAGHGFPDEKQSTAYLLPVDGSSSDIVSTGYSLAKLYGELSSFNLKSAVVFLDACFSGTKREDEMLASARGVAITVKEETPDGNLVVFAAAQGNETAHQMEESHHGMFTYFLLKGLQQSNGDITLGDLTEYVTKQVKRNSVVINNKKQTPNVIPSESMMNKWQTIKL